MSINMNSKIKKLVYAIIGLSIIGFIDSLYLTISHFQEGSVLCSEFSDCNFVLTSEYATILGIPVALLGALFYGFILLIASIYLDKKKSLYLKILIFTSPLGFLASAWFVYIQAFVIYSYCDYCLLSAAASALIFIASIVLYFQIKKSDDLEITEKVQN